MIKKPKESILIELKIILGNTEWNKKPLTSVKGFVVPPGLEPGTT
tara:strand:+ start:263 stop:397 length:135 start_codon:yes stop_codon:yes gene_type:complete